MQTLTSSQRSLLEVQTNKFQESLVFAEDYLARRGITEATAVLARLGAVDEQLPDWPGLETNGNYLSLPYLTRSGVVDIRYRCIREHDCKSEKCGKYLTRTGQPTRIYGVGHLVDAGTSICVTEGELDSLILCQLGYPAVAFPGSRTWKAHYRRLFEDFHRIVVFADGDNDGVAFGEQWSKMFPRSVEVAQMDKQEDVNSAYLLYGEEYFHGILDG